MNGNKEKANQVKLKTMTAELAKDIKTGADLSTLSSQIVKQLENLNNFRHILACKYE